MTEVYIPGSCGSFFDVRDCSFNFGHTKIIKNQTVYIAVWFFFVYGKVVPMRLN